MFEKVLLISGKDLRDKMMAPLQKKRYDVLTAASLPDALRSLKEEPIDMVIFDAGLNDFPLDLFLYCVQKLSPGLEERFLYMVGVGVDAKRSAIIERSQGIKVKRDLQGNDLLETTELLLSRRTF